MKENLNILYALLLYFLNIKISFSYFGKTISPLESEIDTNKETSKLSENKDMGQCTCDLTNRCDFRCCCDKDCDEEIIKKWKGENEESAENICIKNIKERMEDYLCKSREESYKYNKNEAGITVNDHIFNIMCVYYDRSGDMGEFYMDEDYAQEVQTLKKDWINDFLKGKRSNKDFNIGEEHKYKYGDSLLFEYSLYKPDSNGNCIKIDYIDFLKPFQSSCISSDDSINKIPEKNTDYREKSNKKSEITYIINYNNINDNESLFYIDSIESKTLYKDSSKSFKFSVKWKKNGQENKNLPNGYLQGNPIRIKFGNNPLYENGYFLGISDSQGICLEDNKEGQYETILFKINNIFTCLHNNKNPNDYQIYQKLCGENIKIGKSLNSNLNNLNNEDQWIPLDNEECQNSKNIKNINIYLTFLITKEGKENSPYEVIHHAYIRIEEDKKNENTISLIVKFVEFSYSSIENSKKGKITSLIPLPDKLLKALSKKNSNQILNINLIILIIFILFELI